MITEIELIDREGGALLEAYFVELNKYESKTCSVCKIVQGKPLKGFKQYYCKHITDKVDRKVKPMEKALWERITTDIQCGGLKSIGNADDEDDEVRS